LFRGPRLPYGPARANIAAGYWSWGVVRCSAYCRAGKGVHMVKFKLLALTLSLISSITMAAGSAGAETAGFREGELLAPQKLNYSFSSSILNKYKVTIINNVNSKFISISCNNTLFIRKAITKNINPIIGASVEVDDDKNCSVRFITIYAYARGSVDLMSTHMWEIQFDRNGNVTVYPPLERRAHP
jgi:hypothetical protein